MTITQDISTDVARIEPLGEPIVQHETRFIKVTETPVRFPNGVEGTYARVNPGTHGAVVIPHVSSRGISYLGLVEQHRFPIDEVTLEFPRGGTDSTDPAEGARELLEETGAKVDPGSMRHLGLVHADTGLLGTSIDVWFAGLGQAPAPSHIEEATGARVRWVTEGVLLGLISRGKITCGITLASYAVLKAAGINL